MELKILPFSGARLLADPSGCDVNGDVGFGDCITCVLLWVTVAPWTIPGVDCLANVGGGIVIACDCIVDTGGCNVGFGVCSIGVEGNAFDGMDGTIDVGECTNDVGVPGWRTGNACVWTDRLDSTVWLGGGTENVGGCTTDKGGRIVDVGGGKTIGFGIDLFKVSASIQVWKLYNVYLYIVLSTDHNFVYNLRIDKNKIC